MHKYSVRITQHFIRLPVFLKSKETQLHAQVVLFLFLPSVPDKRGVKINNNFINELPKQLISKFCLILLRKYKQIGVPIRSD